MRTLGYPWFALLLQGARGTCIRRPWRRCARPARPLQHHFQGRSSHPGRPLDRVLGHHPSQGVDVPARGATKRAVSRRLPPQQQVLRSAGRLPIARARVRSSACFNPATPSSRLNFVSTRRATPGANPHGPAGRPTLKSLAAVDRALLRASAVEVNKLERRDSVSRDDGEHRTVHRVVRHRVGHYDGVRRDRPDRIDQPRRRRARHLRGADRDGRGAGRGDPRRCSSTTT